MDLLTPTLRESLLTNGRCEADHWPVVKFFNPVGAATWLFSGLDADGDTLFGLCDLGFGFPELGSASLTEIASVRLPLGLRIERDLAFAASHPLSVYAEAARLCSQITEHPDHLERAAQALAQERSRSPP
jgi:dihydroorotate dehydrogenase